MQDIAINLVLFIVKKAKALVSNKYYLLKSPQQLITC